MRACLFAILLSALAGSASAEILVGIAGPMGGPNAVFGEQMKVGVKAAIDGINAAGGINGETLRMVVADDACDARRAAAAADELIKQDVRVVIGHFCTGMAIATAKAYDAAGVMMISPSASGALLTDQGQWNVLRIAAREDAQADVLATKIAADNPQAKIAVIVDGQSPGRAVAQRFKQRAPSSIEFTIKAGVAPGKDLIADLKARAIDAVFLTTAATDAGTLASAMTAAGIKAKLYGTELLLADTYWAKSGNAGEGTVVSFTADPVRLASETRLQTEFLAKSLAIDGATLPSYAAVEAFVASAKATSVNDGKRMAQWLKVGNKITTILGDITFDPKGDPQQQRFTLFRWSVGKFQTIE